MTWPESHVNKSAFARWLCPSFLAHLLAGYAPDFLRTANRTSGNLHRRPALPLVQQPVYKMSPCAGHPQIWQCKPSMISAGIMAMLLVRQLHGHTNHPTFPFFSVCFLFVGCPHGNTSPVVYAP